MKEGYYQQLDADLGMEFHLFTMENPDWVTEHIPAGAVVVMQTADPEFNAWARALAERNRHRETPPRPIVLVHIRELAPERSRILRAEAELVTANLREQ